MPMHPDGIERPEYDRAGERYFVAGHDGVERETDTAGFISMEGNCGFRPKAGCGPFATGGFCSGRRYGRIERPFEGPAVVFDGDTGEREEVENSSAAYDRARELNARTGRRRHHAMHA